MVTMKLLAKVDVPTGADILSRPLTAAEIDLARAMFGDAIDYGRVRLHRRRWWPLQPRSVTMAPDGDIWFHPASPAWRACFACAERGLQGHFIHEMTHVWQAQTRGRWYLPLMRHPFCRYRFTLVPGKPLTAYGLEQQAEIMRVAFLSGEGSPLLA
jgi:hypothetical protein